MVALARTGMKQARNQFTSPTCCKHGQLGSQMSRGELPSLSFEFMSALCFTKYSAMPSLSHVTA